MKPLYWARHDDLIVFASEIKSLLASGLVEPRLDASMIDVYLTLGYVPGPGTLFEGIRKLRPGGILAIDGRVEERCYWEYPPPRPEAVDRGIDIYARELLDLLTEAVGDRLMSDVPLGAMLSGGLDSSVVVALMARAQPDPVHTFSVGFVDDAWSELEDARHVATALGCEHHELALTLDDTVSLENLAGQLEEPVADLSVVGFEAVCRLASQHVKVALSGQGADELFAGYRKHRAAAVIRDLTFLPSVLRRSLAAAPLPKSSVRRALRSLAEVDDAQRLLEMSGRMDAELRRSLLGETVSNGDNTYAAIDRARAGASGDPLAMTLFLDAKLGLVDHMLLYFDKASMAHSLEVRVPFLDHRLVEWAATVPTQHKATLRTTKAVLRRAAAGVVPTGVVRKRKQGFFRESSTAWLTRQIEGDAGESLRSPNARYRDLLEGPEVERLLASFRRRPSEDRARPLFAVLLLEAWLARFLDRTHSTRRASVVASDLDRR